jgi:hypothetical protein
MSKYDILRMMDPEILPRGILIRMDTAGNIHEEYLHEKGLDFPLIAKPDIGERGRGVELLQDFKELQQYLRNTKWDTILQEYIELPLELGILYYRMPGTGEERITSVMIRDFLRVEGDGIKSLRKLIHSRTRTLLRRKYLYKKFHARLDEVPRKGEVILLEPVGNHCRGTRFLDGNHLISPDLLETISGIASSIQGFDYGRFDLKTQSIERLCRGKGFKILELNGTNSEPAHIYDPGYNLISAYRDIIEHMHIIFRISQANRCKGLTSAPFRKFTRDLWKHIRAG